MKKLIPFLALSALAVCMLVPGYAWMQNHGTTPNILSTVSSWSASSQNGKFLVTGVTGQNKIAMVLRKNSEHFALMFSGYNGSTSNGSTIPIQITFDDGSKYSFQGLLSSNSDDPNGDIVVDLPDGKVASWTHNLTVDHDMIITFSKTPQLLWVFDLTGTMPTVTALAKGISDAGITGLPAPWVSMGNTNIGSTLAYPQSVASLASTDSQNVAAPDDDNSSTTGAAGRSLSQNEGGQSPGRVDYCYQLHGTIASLSLSQQAFINLNVMDAGAQMNELAAQDGLPIFDNNAYVATILAGSEAAGVSVPQDFGDYLLELLPDTCKFSPKSSILFELMVDINSARSLAGYPTIPQMPSNIGGDYGG